MYLITAMAKYYGSPWGFLKGKLGPAVGSKVRGGIHIVRAYSHGNHKTLEHALQGKILPKELSVRRINHNNAAFGPIAHIAKRKSYDLILPVWEPMAKGTPLTGANLFVKYNVPLLDKFPYPKKFYTTNNMPNLENIILSYGTLEPSYITSSSYHPTTGTLQIKWNTETFKDGSPQDLAYLMSIAWKLPPPQIPDLPPPQPHKTIKIWGDALKPVAKRKNGKASIKIQKRIHPQKSHLIAYLFFSNSKKRFSISISSKILLSF